MKLSNSTPTLPVHDYSSALQSAVSWLGDRYLLAAPVAPRQGMNRNLALFLQQEPWLWLDKPRT